METRPAFSSLVLLLSFCNDYVAFDTWSPEDMDKVIDVCMVAPSNCASWVEAELAKVGVYVKDDCGLYVEKDTIIAFSNTRCCSDPSHGMLSFSTW